MPITLQPLTREHAASFCSLVIALAEFEKLVPPDAAARLERLHELWSATQAVLANWV